MDKIAPETKENYRPENKNGFGEVNDGPVDMDDCDRPRCTFTRDKRNNLETAVKMVVTCDLDDRDPTRCGRSLCSP